jgi:ABC-type dipeptide/oligopeptide/nickel transport system ATPase component
VYLRDCHFENCGPISSIDLSLGFDHDDHPKPLLLVGENGAGKTIMMSMVADALALLGQRVFEDIISKKNPIGTTYLRAVGPATKPYGAPYALGLLRFSSGARSMYWHEKTGVLDVATLLD